jgi:hypothetical protein
LKLRLYRETDTVSIIFLEDKHKIVLHLSILYEYQQFFQHRICFSIQPQLQLVNLHRNRRYFVIKLHTWFCLSYFLKTNIKLYSRNMIDKTMCKVLWRNISDFYVNLRVEVGKHPQVILAMYFYLGQEVKVSRYNRNFNS